MRRSRLASTHRRLSREVGTVRGRVTHGDAACHALTLPCLPSLCRQFNLARAEDMSVLWITNASSYTRSSTSLLRGLRRRLRTSPMTVSPGSKTKLKGQFIKLISDFS